MALEDDIRILSAVSLFSGFTDNHLRLLAFGAEPVALPKGRKLYQEDDVAESAYVVMSGSIVLYREKSTVRSGLGNVGAGGILGELALIAETTWMTCAAAESDASLLRLNRRTFRRILEEYPETAVSLRAHIAESFKALIGRLEAVSQRIGSE